MSERREKGSLRPVERVEKGLKPNTGLKPTRQAPAKRPDPPAGGGSTSKN